MNKTPTSPKIKRGSIIKLLRNSLHYLSPYWIEYSVVTIAIILSQIFNVNLILTPKLIVDEAITQQNWGRFLSILTGLVGLFLVSTFFNLSADYLIGRAEEELKKDLRLEFFTALQRLPSHFFSKSQPGEVVALFATDLMTFRDALRTLLPNAFSALLQLGLIIIALIALDWRLSIAVGLALLVVLMIPRSAIQKASEADYRSKTSDVQAAFVVQDNVQSQAIIRAFGLQEAEIQRYKSGIGRDQNVQIHEWASIWSEIRGGLKVGIKRSYFLKTLVGTLSNLQSVILNAVVIIVGGYLAFHG